MLNRPFKRCAIQGGFNYGSLPRAVDVVATVQDDGVGISPEALPRLFDPFYTTKRPEAVQVCGLSICLSIAREHGGTIQAECRCLEADRHFAFICRRQRMSWNRLRQSVCSAKSRSDSSTGDGPRPVPTVLKGISVLVLDDEESIRSLLEEGLSAHGLTVSCAASAEEAATLVSVRSFDALLMRFEVETFGSIQRWPFRSRSCAKIRKNTQTNCDFHDRRICRCQWRRGRLSFSTKPFRILDVLAIMREAFVTSSEGSSN